MAKGYSNNDKWKIGITLAGAIFAVWLASKLNYQQAQQQRASTTLQSVDQRSLSTQQQLGNLASIVGKVGVSLQTMTSQINAANDRIDHLRQETYSKSEVSSMVDKISDQIDRLGNVMYGDRQELRTNLENSDQKLSTRIQRNTGNLQYLYGMYRIRAQNYHEPSYQHANTNFSLTHN